jgi:hypothetical protein
MNEHDAPDTIQDQPDRRREHRWELQGGVEAACRVGALGEGPDVALALIEVSARGARLLVRDALPPGQAVEIRIYATGGAAGFLQAVEGFLRPARVVWSTAARGGHHFAGVEFETPLDPEGLETLRRFCRPGPP